MDPDPFPLNLRLRWWTAAPRRADAVDAPDRVLTAARHQLRAAELPFPTRQILFNDQTEDSDGDRGRQREEGPAGEADVAALRKVAEAFAQISPFKPRRVGGE